MTPAPLYFIGIGQSGISMNAANLRTALAQAYPGSLYIDRAVPGSLIQNWQPGTINYQTALAAGQQAALDGYQLGAILCYIGQSDATDAYQSTVTLFRSRLLACVNQLRADLGVEYGPIMLGILGEHPHPPAGHQQFAGWDAIKSQQLDICATHPGGYFPVKMYNAGIYIDDKPYCHRDADGLAVECGRWVNQLQAHITG